MGADLVQAFPAARRTFAEADDALGMGLSRLCCEGPEETLALTEHAQPAILTASLAAYRVLEETAGLAPRALAGHSLGEWSALVAAGSLGLADAVRAVRERGRLMQAAVPVGEGGMAAVLGLDVDAVAALCREAASGDVLAPANLNGGGQVVVAGRAAAVDRLVALVAAKGGGRAQRLTVSAPFHCALMAPAADGLARYLQTVRFEAPRVPVVTSVDARLVTGAGELRDLLVRQVTAPVRWEETARTLATGATLALEVGPGRVLSGLFRRIVPALATVPAGDVAGIAKAREALA